MTDDKNIVVRSQMIPLDGIRLVLPNTAIAEIIVVPQIDKLEDTPEWVVGALTWRDLQIPLIAFEMAAEYQTHLPTIDKRSRIIILNTISGSENLPFYALIAQGLPRLLAIDHANTQDAPEQMETKPFELRHIIVDGNLAIIPDQQALEGAITNLGLTVKDSSSESL